MNIYYFLFLKRKSNDIPNIKAKNAPISKGDLFLVPNPNAARIRQVKKHDTTNIIKKSLQVGFIFFLLFLSNISTLFSSLREGESGREDTLPLSKSTSSYPQSCWIASIADTISYAPAIATNA